MKQVYKCKSCGCFVSGHEVGIADIRQSIVQPHALGQMPPAIQLPVHKCQVMEIPAYFPYSEGAEYVGIVELVGLLDDNNVRPS